MKCGARFALVKKRPHRTHPGLPALAREPPRVEVVIEIPRWSFLKRGSAGSIDFVSPLPCPFNYGSVPGLLGGEGDLLDAVVLGRRLAIGTRVETSAYRAIGLSERFMRDDKLICSDRPLNAAQQWFVLAFFRFYALCKGLLNRYRGRPGASRCEGWGDATLAVGRCAPAGDDWRGPPVPY